MDQFARCHARRTHFGRLLPRRPRHADNFSNTACRYRVIPAQNVQNHPIIDGNGDANPQTLKHDIVNLQFLISTFRLWLFGFPAAARFAFDAGQLPAHNRAEL
jgi:hypothetical protein